MGNITRVRNAATDTLFFNNAMVSPDQVYTYDALYRLVIAEGREHISNTGFNSQDNNNDSGMIVAPAPLQWDINALQTYTQRFSYDAVGNIRELKHSAAHGGYTRTYAYAGSNNRLTGTTVGSMIYTYNYDVRGNMVHMPHLSVMGWNSLNELYGIANSDMQTWYQYSGGQRVRKYVEKATGVEERIYLGNFEIYRKFETLGSLTPIVERTTVHISDDTGRIAMRELRNTDYDDDGSEEKLTRYIYSNHLQSASLELNEEAKVISYEEYHPYGTTAYQASNSAINAVAKRYRYTGKERDEESGLYYHGARYYVPWLARWTAVDPMESKYAGMSPYNYSFNNPVMFNDPSGADPGDGDNKKKAANSLSASRYSMPSINTTGQVDNARDVRSIIPLKATALKQLPDPVEHRYFSAKSQDQAVVFNKNYAQNQIRRAFDKEMAARAALDPYAYTLANSPGVQGGLAMALPGYGEAMSGLQIYSGIQTGNKTQIALGSAGLLLSGYSSYNFYKNGGYAGSATAASESKFVPATETPALQAAKMEGTPVSVSAGTKITLSVEEAAKVNPTYATTDIEGVISKSLRLQKQIDEHVIGGKRLETNSYFNSAEDASKVLEATHGGEASILSINIKQNRVYVEFDDVVGYYNNNGVIILTNKFLIKGGKSATVVPIHPKSSTFK